MKIIKNVNRNDVFKLLEQGKTVFLFNEQNETVVNLLFETILYLSKVIENKSVIFFTVEETNDCDGCFAPSVNANDCIDCPGR